MKSLSKEAMKAILYGTGTEKLRACTYNRGNGTGALEQPFEGVLTNICSAAIGRPSPTPMRKELEECMATAALPGMPRRPPQPEMALAVTVGGMNITRFLPHVA